MDSDQWLSHFFGPELIHLEAGCRDELHRLFHQTRRQLVDFDFSFEPLLPDEEAPLEDRALALSDWCHGFLQGIGYSGPSAAWPGECSEILQDFLEIVRLDALGFAVLGDVGIAGAEGWRERSQLVCRREAWKAEWGYVVLDTAPLLSGDRRTAHTSPASKMAKNSE